MRVFFFCICSPRTSCAFVFLAFFGTSLVCHLVVLLESPFHFPLTALPCSCHGDSHTSGSLAFLHLLACFFFWLPLVSIHTSSCPFVERSLHSCSLVHAELFCMLLSGTLSCPAPVSFHLVSSSLVVLALRGHLFFAMLHVCVWFPELFLHSATGRPFLCSRHGVSSLSLWAAVHLHICIAWR